jgi:hypothetical protein
VRGHFYLAQHPCCAGGLLFRPPPFFLPAVCGRRTPWLQGFIGGNRQHLNKFLIFLAHPKGGDADCPKKGHIIESHNKRKNHPYYSQAVYFIIFMTLLAIVNRLTGFLS